MLNISQQASKSSFANLRVSRTQMKALDGHILLAILLVVTECLSAFLIIWNREKQSN